MSVSPAGQVSAVAEVLGLDGLFSFPEKLLQQLWHRREFELRGAATADGRKLEVLYPGKWNFLGGPDFLGARLRVDGVPVNGDVELHLRACDWAAHGHAADPAYDDVVLHVVLFPAMERSTRGAGGKEIPIIALLPLLFHGLEEYAADAAVETLANRPSVQILQRLGSLAPEALHALLEQHARARWEQKVRFARTRLEKLGWDSACHHAALEILGYRFNRVPMLRTAAAYPLERWAAGEVAVETVLAEFKDEWRLHGVRPANHPRTRLRQYLAWMRACPDWPSRLALWTETVAASVPRAGGDSTAAIRKAWKFPALREQMAFSICGAALSGTRLDNLVCDGFLPLLAAGDGGSDLTAATLWMHGYPGDAPALLARGLRDLGVTGTREAPLSHGKVQGLLGWILAEEGLSAAAGAPPTGALGPDA